MRKILLIAFFSILLLAGAGCGQNALNNKPALEKNNTASQSGQAQNDDNNKIGNDTAEKPDISRPLTYSSKYGFYGTVEAKGYLMKKPGNDKYIFFYVEETDNLDLLNFIMTKKDDPYLGAQAVGLGCYEKGKRIYSTSFSDGMDNKITQANNAIEGLDLQLLEKTVPNRHFVTLRMRKPVSTNPVETPECYSYFSDFEVVVKK